MWLIAKYALVWSVFYTHPPCMKVFTDLAKCLPPPGPEALGRAGHSALVHGQHMWVYGGYRLGDGQVAASGVPEMSSFMLEQPGSPDDLVRFVIILLLHM